MSKKFLDRFGNVEVPSREEIRSFLNIPEPERDGNGNILYVTEQAHRDRCDVNKIIARYAKTGLIDHVTDIEAAYGDMSGRDFKEMVDRVVGIQAKFNELPSSIRKEFGNDPSALLAFFENPDNRGRAIELGLIRGDSVPDRDGLGEHVKKEAGPPSP